MAAPKSNAFVLTATDYGPMLVNRFDYCGGPGNIWGVGHELLNTSSYEADVIKILTELLNVRREFDADGVVVMDCGANVGTFTLSLARHILGWGELLAIEAQERVFYALAGNIAINNLFNARALWTAVGEASGSIEIPRINYLEPASFGSLELMESMTNEDIGQTLNRSPGRGQVVAMTTIDELASSKVGCWNKGIQRRPDKGGHCPETRSNYVAAGMMTMIDELASHRPAVRSITQTMIYSDDQTMASDAHRPVRNTWRLE